MGDTVVFDRAALDALLNSADGPVAKHLTKLAVRVERRAKHLAPVDTGRLRASVTNELGRDGRGLVVRVGTNVHYAPHLEYGTVRMRARPFLRPALGSVTGV